jgi:hypothetical protein
LSADYDGLQRLIEDVEARHSTNHDEDYYRSLLGIRKALVEGTNPLDSSHFDYPRLWLERKVFWKILMTPYSRIEDADQVQPMRDALMISAFSAPIPVLAFRRDQDQFVALRNDCANLLEAYCKSLHSRVVPGYQRKQEHGYLADVVADAETMRAWRAEEKRRDAELTRNGFENDEQFALYRSLSQIEFYARNVIQGSFCWPPEDDERIADIVRIFPSLEKSREKLLSEVSAIRAAHLAAIKSIEAKQKATEGNRGKK